MDALLIKVGHATTCVRAPLRTRYINNAYFVVCRFSLFVQLLPPRHRSRKIILRPRRHSRPKPHAGPATGTGVRGPKKQLQVCTGGGGAGLCGRPITRPAKSLYGAPRSALFPPVPPLGPPDWGAVSNLYGAPWRCPSTRPVGKVWYVIAMVSFMQTFLAEASIVLHQFGSWLIRSSSPSSTATLKVHAWQGTPVLSAVSDARRSPVSDGRQLPSPAPVCPRASSIRSGRGQGGSHSRQAYAWHGSVNLHASALPLRPHTIISDLADAFHKPARNVAVPFG